MYFKKPDEKTLICTADGEPFPLKEHRRAAIDKLIDEAQKGYAAKEKLAGRTVTADVDDYPSIKLSLDVKPTFERMLTFLLATGPHQTREIKDKEGVTNTVPKALWGHEDQMHVHTALRLFREGGQDQNVTDKAGQVWYFMEKADYEWLLKAVQEEGPVVFASAEPELYAILTEGALEKKPKEKGKKGKDDAED